ncbi:MAG: hypothetical protein GY913_10220 [Proteobacteria bacterium]|nr:hypothetical protein [Pseudomonadota bacterium]MCP4917287.1 hypothetical protein [Pseudomonadota bacterium]
MTYAAWVSLATLPVRSGIEHLDKIHAMQDGLRALDDAGFERVVAEALEHLERGTPDEVRFAAWIFTARTPERELPVFERPSHLSSLPEAGIWYMRSGWSGPGAGQGAARGE